MLIDSKSKWTLVQIHVDEFKFFMPWPLCTRALSFTRVRLSVRFHSVIWVPLSQIIWNSYTRSVTIKEGQFLFSTLPLFFLAHLAKGKVSFCHHLASIVCHPLTFHILIFSSETPQPYELKLGRKHGRHRQFMFMIVCFLKKEREITLI